MTEKEILFQMLDREVNNIVIKYIPMFSPFSSAISNFIKNGISPYIDAFMMGSDSLNTVAAGEFIKTEVSEKVDEFIKKFNEKRDAL